MGERGNWHMNMMASMSPSGLSWSSLRLGFSAWLDADVISSDRWPRLISLPRQRTNAIILRHFNDHVAGTVLSDDRKVEGAYASCRYIVNIGGLSLPDTTKGRSESPTSGAFMIRQPGNTPDKRNECIRTVNPDAPIGLCWWGVQTLNTRMPEKSGKSRG